MTINHHDNNQFTDTIIAVNIRFIREVHVVISLNSKRKYLNCSVTQTCTNILKDSNPQLNRMQWNIENTFIINRVCYNENDPLQLDVENELAKRR